jgi:GntR family transcriptional repressor for pyruvate dehydrogenase complex
MFTGIKFRIIGASGFGGRPTPVGLKRSVESIARGYFLCYNLAVGCTTTILMEFNMEHKFTRIEIKSLRASAAHEIERRIFSGELKPGDRLPPERELAAAMGISRPLLNFAIKDLEARGFVRIVPRHGAYVNDYKQNSTPQMLMSLIGHSRENVDDTIFADLLDTRRLLERECTRLAAGRVTREELAMMRACLDEMSGCRTADCFALANYRFHHVLATASGNIVYAMILRSFEDAIVWYLTAYSVTEERRRVSVGQHEQLLGALSRGDGAAADAAVLAIFSEGIDKLKELFRH